MEVYFLSADEKERIDFDGKIYGISDMDLFKHEFSYILQNRKITKFEKDVSSYEIEVNVSDGGGKSWQENYHHIQNIFDDDILKNVRGKLYVNQYYLLCNFYAGSVEDQFRSWCDFQTCLLKVVSDAEAWCREKTCHFYASTQAAIDSGNREEINEIIDNSEIKPEYPYDYPYGYKTRYRAAKKRYIRDYKYDYYKNHTVGRLDNDHFAESDFKMIIYGPCLNPEIRIGDNLCRVATTLYDSEYMVIDSRARTVIRYARNGVAENLFNKRDKQNDIFAKIPAGKCTVKWPATYSFDITLFQERSEPPWT